MDPDVIISPNDREKTCSNGSTWKLFGGKARLRWYGDRAAHFGQGSNIPGIQNLTHLPTKGEKGADDERDGGGHLQLHRGWPCTTPNRVLAGAREASGTVQGVVSAWCKGQNGRSVVCDKRKGSRKNVHFMPIDV